MQKRCWILLVILPIVFVLGAQNTLSINGLNEAQFIYRTAEDSLNAYFTDSFSFNLGYRNFRFGMKFVADLPKYSNQQGELLQTLDPNRLELGWKELYASYSKDAFTIHAGTTEESFGQGISFRSYRDIEFDEDHRIESFLVKYDEALKLKALYGAIPNQSNPSLYDVVYGADLLYPLVSGFNLGASAVAFRELAGASRYSQRDVFSGRVLINLGSLEAYAEYAESQLYRLSGIDVMYGSAKYANLDYMLGNLQLGGAYKHYDDFQYRLHDLPLANYHGETLSDALASGADEEGWQVRAAYKLLEKLSVNTDYAEAWDTDKDLRMNDLFGAIDFGLGSSNWQLSYSHVEKLDDIRNTWQKEQTPALSTGFSMLKIPIHCSAEFKMVEKQKQQTETKHYEPKVQADIRLGKLSLSLGAQSWWTDFEEITNSRYWANIEAKYSLFTHSDLLLFAGKEAGGKVCRNGVCRYVSAFQGVKAELSTRF